MIKVLVLIILFLMIIGVLTELMLLVFTNEPVEEIDEKENDNEE